MFAAVVDNFVENVGAGQVARTLMRDFGRYFRGLDRGLCAGTNGPDALDERREIGNSAG